MVAKSYAFICGKKNESETMATAGALREVVKRRFWIDRVNGG